MPVVTVFVIVIFGGKDMNSVEDLDVFKLAHELALKTLFSYPSVSEGSLVWEIKRGVPPDRWA